jgi:hypothetical protein
LVKANGIAIPEPLASQKVFWLPFLLAAGGRFRYDLEKDYSFLSTTMTGRLSSIMEYSAAENSPL